MPRSPTLPQEIRRLSPAKPQSPPVESRCPALVARLMGLEAVPAASPVESAEEKRRRLLGALQRCDEDLKALKKIIEAVRSADPPPATAPEVSQIAGEFGDKIRTVSEVKCSVSNGEQQQQQPSPVSVLDEFTRSPLSPSCYSGRHSFGKASLVLLCTHHQPSSFHCYLFICLIFAFPSYVNFKCYLSSVAYNKCVLMAYKCW